MLQLQEGGVVYLLTGKVGHRAMRALMVLPLRVQGPVPFLAWTDTSMDDWNARCRMDPPPNWLSSRRLCEGTINEGQEDVEGDSEGDLE